MGLSDSGLGRSVSDVLAKTMRRGEPSKGYLEVDLGLITPPRANPRQDFDQSALDELAASIRQHGILQPIVVMKREVGYEILSGERRFRAAKLAGLVKVPVVIREEENPQHVAELRLIENIQRENLNPIELARAYRVLIDQHGLTHDDLADRVNKDRSSVTNLMRLLTLDEGLQRSLASAQLSMGHAKALLSCVDPIWRRTLADRIITEGLSVREAERLAKDGPPKAPVAAGERPSHVRELEANLFQLLGTRVKVTERKGKGNLTLYFDGNDQFQRVVAIMTRFVKQAGSEDRKP
ncbi:MAG: ParB/RepB/Spo0J family partition protein [Planctomycetes bacterium]|nr:ParB/RepB/Spo0J family partition protein [Planctomycetota bacterium]